MKKGKEEIEINRSAKNKDVKVRNIKLNVIDDL
jgi:hypothetical protein